MFPETPFLFAFAIALAFRNSNVISLKLAVICAFLAVFIDIDHYIEHIIHARRNKFSLLDTWNNIRHIPERSFIHHKIGIAIFTTLFLLIYLISPKISLIMAIAYYSHIILDYVKWHKVKYLRLMIFNFKIRETHTEMFINILLVVIILIMLFY